MDFLKQANLTVYTVADKASPLATRRMRLAQKVEEQIKLAIDSTYRPTKIVWSRGADGVEHKVEQPKRIRCWWTECVDGTVLLTVRYGSKALELAKGKNAVKLNSKADIEPTLRNLKLSVLGGEFDELLLRQVGFKLKIGAGKKGN